MRKICFSDRYGLTEAVLDGRKTMTRRLAFDGLVENPCTGYGLEGKEKDHYLLLDGCRQVAKSTYKFDEYVAIAQRYADCNRAVCLRESAGWDNKMFVRPDLMPHQIQIINIEVQRLQDISDEDCLKEGMTDAKRNGVIGNTLMAVSISTPLTLYEKHSLLSLTRYAAKVRGKRTLGYSFIHSYL